MLDLVGDASTARARSASKLYKAAGLYALCKRMVITLQKEINALIFAPHSGVGLSKQFALLQLITKLGAEDKGEGFDGD